MPPQRGFTVTATANFEYTSELTSSLVVDPLETCVAVLDLSRRCDSAEAACSEILPAVRDLLDRARAHGASRAFTISRSQRHTNLDGVASALGREPDEPVFYPDSFDKFDAGGLLEFVRARGCNRIVLCGSATNICVMYSATSALRVHGLDVIIPVDCVNSSSGYKQFYALYQLLHLPQTTGTLALTTGVGVEFGS